MKVFSGQTDDGNSEVFAAKRGVIYLSSTGMYDGARVRIQRKPDESSTFEDMPGFMFTAPFTQRLEVAPGEVRLVLELAGSLTNVDAFIEQVLVYQA